MHELGPKWSTFLTQYIGEAFVAAGVQPSSRSDTTVVQVTVSVLIVDVPSIFPARQDDS